MSKIVVIGSANMDTTHYLASEFPDDLTQESLNEIVKTARVLGGKGANQARAAKLQSKDNQVYFIGCVGEDESGVKMLEEFKRVGVNFKGVKVLKGKNTDGRIIDVDKNGENRMKGYGDCVKELKPETIDMTILENADIVAIQMKMPQETVKFVIDYCKRNNKPLVIDPTPPEKANILMEENAKLLGEAAYLTPNEEEAFALIKYAEGKDIAQIKKEFKETPKEVRLQMIQQFVQEHPNVIATVGGEGVIYHNGKGAIRKRTFPTECKDSTGAGDTFNGAFIASLARGEGLDRAVEYGLMASSIKVRYEGAQNGVPTYDETTKAINVYERKNRTHEDD